jgi:hypothetical protein
MSIVQRDSALHDRLAALAREAHIAIVTGLPGTGKSLLIHELAHLAVAQGRAVHLLQWDVARPVFEATAAGRRHPVRDGVTQPIIRRAVGTWARRAVADWAARYAGPAHVLVGEAPLVGDRLAELVRPRDDAVEAVLGGHTCRFVLPVPSREVRRHVEAERERRAVDARHPREREDAPPPVLRELWRHLLDVAPALGVPVATEAYDPEVYRRVYEHVLRHRTVDVVPVDQVLPTASMSVYDFAVSCTDLVPDDAHADQLMREMERRYPDPTTLAREVDAWWKI